MHEQTIFIEALERADPAERAAFLDRQCAHDPALRKRIDRLLERHERADGFLDSPAIGMARTATDVVREGSGTVIGPYKLLEQIGEGGFGLVFLAEQQQPVRRQVAIKLVKPGMDTRQVIARFEAERQALALMDHPNIAHVLEAGETSTGRPYFAMELVRGVTITDYCDKNNLTPRDRLELFLAVCQAVQHAHLKGIIHRDLKPSNILVTSHDGIPVVKVIDFGIAKALGQQLTEKSLYTGFAQLVGTPLYMSPEQAEMSGLDVDTRSDIYSLGVLFYELLTGTTPFDKERLAKASYDEMRRIIREEEPARPSTLLRKDESGRMKETKGAKRTRWASLSPLASFILHPSSIQELDWIAMKALDKDRNRRYETANGLAADVLRYLHDEPVSACPPSAWYRLGKFGRRHRWGLALSGVVAAALVVLVAGSLIWAAFLNDALYESEGQRRRAERAEKAAVVAERAARERLYSSLRAQAHASRFSNRMGRRFKSLEALAEAAKIAHDLDTAAADDLDLRNEAIACLALLDLRVAKEWNGWPAGSMTLDFDGAVERYARVDRQGVVHIHCVADGGEICNLPGFGPGNFGGGETYPCFSPDGRFLLLARGQSIEVWTLAGQEPVQIPLLSRDCTGYAFSPDSRELAVVQPNGPIRLYDLVSGRQLKQLPGVANSRRAAFHPRSRQLAVGHALGVQILDLETGEALADLKQPASDQIAWHPHGTMLAIVGADDMIHLWDMATRQPVARLERRRSGGFGFAFNHVGDLLAGIGFDGILYLWETRTGRQLFSTQVAAAGLPRFSPDDQMLAGGVDPDSHTLRLWHLPFPLGYRTLDRGQGFCCAISPKEPLLAVGAGDGIALWDLTTSAQVDFLKVGWSSVIFEPSGALLASGRGDGVRRWPMERDSAKPGLLRIGPPQKLPLPDRRVAIAMNQDGRVLASPGFGVTGGRGLVWHRDQPGPMVQLPFQEDSRNVAISPGGDWVATGSHWGTKVQISDARTGKPAHELLVDGGSRIRFSPDGRWLATTGGGCRLWEVGSWRQGRHIGGEILAFSPDGKLLAVENGHGAVRLVDPVTGREYARLEDPGQARAEDMCFTPDGSQLVISSGDSGSIQVWDLRIIRHQLTEINLDWQLPAYPPAVAHHDRVPLRAETDVGPEFALARFDTLARAGKYDEIVHLADIAGGLPPAGWKQSHQAVKFLERGLRAVHDDARLPEAQRQTRCRMFLERARAHALEALKRGAPAVAGALEAETLPVLDWQGCQTVVQYIFDYDWGANWSNGMQLMANDMKKDGFIEVEVAAPREGRYRLLVQFCRSYDYGIVEIQLDGSKVGKAFDGYATAVVLAGEQEVAVVELSQGKHRLRFTAVDKNEKSRGYQLGIDYLKLQPASK